MSFNLDFNKVVINTGRLILRAPKQRDLEALFKMHGDAEALKYWGAPPITQMSEAQQILDRLWDNMAKGAELALALQCRESGEMLGNCKLFCFHHQCRRAEIGYSLRREFWGKGYMNEALEAMLAFAFKTMDLNRIEADIDPDNIGSKNALLRLGFAKEGYLKERWIVDGKVTDSELYGLLRRDWQAR